MGDFVPFTNPVIAGTTLIRTAIKSPDYVPGVSGWSINKDGSVEFNDAEIRGELIAGGGTVVLDDDGLLVEGLNNQYVISSQVGFRAMRLPDDGTFAFIDVFDSPDSAGGYVALSPQDPTPVNGNSYSAPGFILADTNEVGGTDYGVLLLDSPNFPGKTFSYIALIGQGSNSGSDDSAIDIRTGKVRILNDIIEDSNGHQMLRGENGEFLMSFASAVSGTAAVVFDTPFDNPPFVTTNIRSGAGATARWVSRAINITTTGFTYFVFSGNAVAAAWTNVEVTWQATEYT